MRSLIATVLSVATLLSASSIAQGAYRHHYGYHYGYAVPVFESNGNAYYGFPTPSYIHTPWPIHAAVPIRPAPIVSAPRYGYGPGYWGRPGYWGGYGYGWR
jgi:hypothetical protein